MNTVQERLMGTEVEYSSFDVAAGTEPQLDSRRELYPNLPFGLRQIAGFLTNGSRLYVDVGMHLEYATPESRGPREATLNEIAGERVVDALIKTVGAMRRKKLVGNKRLRDDAGNVWGSHHSFEVDREVFAEIASRERMGNPSRYQKIITTHLATQSIFTGSGMYLPNGSYIISQKNNKTSAAITGQTTGKDKGLINFRDEPHSDRPDELARLHVQAAEASMSPWSTWMQLGMMSILLRGMEAGEVPQLPVAADSAVAARMVAVDTSLSAELRMEVGAKMTALEIQSYYADYACKLSELGILSPEEMLVAAEWRQIVSDLGTNGAVDCSDRVDWIARKELVGQYLEARRDKVDNIDKTRRKLDLLYDRTDQSSLGNKLRKIGHFALSFSEEEIQHAIVNPPDTRAATRGKVIAKAPKGTISALGWSEVKIGTHEYSFGSPGKYNQRVARRLIKLARLRVRN